jgi:hypothetical protein
MSNMVASVCAIESSATLRAVRVEADGVTASVSSTTRNRNVVEFFSAIAPSEFVGGSAQRWKVQSLKWNE